MTLPRLLLVEDDPNLGEILAEFLTVKGNEVTRATDGEAGLQAWKNGKFDLCILDVMLPKKDGFDLARDIRKVDQQIPILFLTAKNMLEAKAEGFGLGGDDYLTKPFSVEELLLRIKALLRRSSPTHTTTVTSEKETFKLGNFEFDFTYRELKIGKEVKRITSREADLLRLLCLHQNQILKREDALKQIWGDDSYFNARSMDVFITKLRKYLKDDPKIEIMNVHGTGYKLLVG
ncbi:MAG: response regulator transcription factor [Bacteroidetes bacterium]|jgi:DNA-binding response OmpR family regulator|nr:response regulator transcription factor [Bacteroidota bacterium]MBL0015723.1 response regulator transcription factor [Bacteroidota bacterium]MBP6722591.1 response regulator transcription factor [Bacteroidia bacterium]